MLKAGAASIVINNELGRSVQGASVDNVAKAIRDDLEANALYLDDGTTALLFVSCDVVGLTREALASMLGPMAAAAGVPERSVIVGGTHTHSGPSVIATNPRKPIDRDYLASLGNWLQRVAAQAAERAAPARLGWGLGSARIGYNRRCCWADGTHSMHGDTRRPDFTGLEGPEDPSHLALFVTDGDGQVKAVLYNNATHPTAFYGADFYSADFPGAARGHLREALGHDAAVLFFNGAFGDQANESMLTKHFRAETREQKVLRIAHLVSGETLRLLHEASFLEDVVLGHAHEDMDASVRLPGPEQAAWARDTLRRMQAGEDVPRWDSMRAFGTRLLLEQFGGNPVDRLPVHAVRLGELALVSQPCELYCQFGLDIKRRSPAAATGVLYADGAEGYCPTAYGPLGGGYSGEPLHWTRFTPETGYRLADTACRLLHVLWQ